MTPYYHDDWLTIYQGDVRDVLPQLASDSVDCIVTSPPYWGLRDYGTASWVGGSEACDHVVATRQPGEAKASTLDGGKRILYDQEQGVGARHQCPKCGAVRQDSQLGLERTPEEYVANLVAVFRELRRVLKPTGTAWLNLGDSYASSTGHNDNSGFAERHAARYPDKSYKLGKVASAEATPDFKHRRHLPGLKPKDLVGIPWRVAFALQADGWYLRSDIIWAKPNPMPESVTDRPTKAHEYLFLLTKSARYFYDAEAVAERAQLWSGRAAEFSREGNPVAEHIIPGQSAAQHRARTNGKHSTTDPHAAGRRIVENVKAARAAGADHDSPFGPTRNLRSVWTIATRPYPGAHFAVFPPELPERCIKAGSSERGACPDCGAPWERVVNVVRGERDDTGRTHSLKEQRNGKTPVPERGWESDRTTTGWAPTCACLPVVLDPAVRQVPGSAEGHGDRVVPAVILDPFAGSGTTGMVANRLSRRAILIDLNGDYLKQQLKRNAQTPLGLGA